MRLTILAGAITLALSGCASNVSNTHSAPRLVSTSHGASSASTVQTDEPEVLIPAPNTPSTAAVGITGKSASSVAAPASKATTASSSLFVPSKPATTPRVDASVTTAVRAHQPAANASTVQVKTSAPQVKTPAVTPVQTSKVLPNSAGPDLNKQVAPHYSYLRVTHLIPGRLTFNDKTKEFEFVIVGGPASLKPNLQTLLSATNGGGLEYKVDENHGYPNTFKLRGQTVTHIIDQMVAPFKQPGQAWQSVYINNMVVIDYTKRMASYAS